MDIIDLKATEEGVIVQDLAALDLTGQEIFESVGIQEVVGTAESEDLTGQGSKLDAVIEDHTPSVSQTKQLIEDSDHRQTARHMAISNMVQGTGIARESIQERLERINRELQEISALPDEELGPRNAEELQKTGILHHKLTQISKNKLEVLQHNLFGENQTVNGSVGVTLPRVRLDASDMQKLLELDRRITRLERVVGPVESLGKSFLTKIDELKSQTALLSDDNEILDRFHERLQEIQEDYENSLLGRKSKNTPELHQAAKEKMFTQESRLNDLHRFHGTLQVYGPILLQLTERVKQISGIDGKLSECFKIASSTDTLIKELQEQAKKWEQVNGSLEQKLATQESDLAHNKEYFERLLANLESRSR